MAFGTAIIALLTTVGSSPADGLQDASPRPRLTQPQTEQAANPLRARDHSRGCADTTAAGGPACRSTTFPTRSTRSIPGGSLRRRPTPFPVDQFPSRTAGGSRDARPRPHALVRSLSPEHAEGRPPDLRPHGGRGRRRATRRPAAASTFLLGLKGSDWFFVVQRDLGHGDRARAALPDPRRRPDHDRGPAADDVFGRTAASSPRRPSSSAPR